MSMFLGNGKGRSGALLVCTLILGAAGLGFFGCNPNSIGRPCVNPSGQVPLSDFYSAFTPWATSAGIKNIPARNMLKANLVNLGYAVRHTNSHSSVVFGLELAEFYPASVSAAAE